MSGASAHGIRAVPCTTQSCDKGDGVLGRSECCKGHKRPSSSPPPLLAIVRVRQSFDFLVTDSYPLEGALASFTDLPSDDFGLCLVRKAQRYTLPS